MSILSDELQTLVSTPYGLSIKNSAYNSIIILLNNLKESIEKASANKDEIFYIRTELATAEHFSKQNRDDISLMVSKLNLWNSRLIDIRNVVTIQETADENGNKFKYIHDEWGIGGV